MGCRRQCRAGFWGSPGRPTTSGSPTPVGDREWFDAQVANVVLGAHSDDPGFGYRFLADELCGRVYFNSNETRDDAVLSAHISPCKIGQVAVDRIESIGDVDFMIMKSSGRGPEVEPGVGIRLNLVDGRVGTLVYNADDTDGSVQMHMKLSDGSEFNSNGYDLWDAFRSLRISMESQGGMVCCEGARINVHPSGMSRGMGAGSSAYRLRLGFSARRRNLRGIFEPTSPKEIGTVAEQDAFFERWLRGFKL